MSQENDSVKYQLIGLFVVIYLISCLLVIGSFWGPLIFIIWLCSGWKVSRLITDKYLLGSEEVKTVATVGLFSAILGILLML